MATVRRTFAFDDERDAGLLARLDALPDGKKSAAAREGLRLHFEQTQPEPGLAEVLAEIASARAEVLAVLADLARRGVVAMAGPEAAAENDDDAALLDALLDLGV
jgi:hypothetical protein